MTQSHCRISRVFPKSGGVIERLRLPERDEEQASLLRNARVVSGEFESKEMVGHVVIAWNEAGGYSCGYRTQGGIPKTLLPSWAADVIRRSMSQGGDWS